MEVLRQIEKIFLEVKEQTLFVQGFSEFKPSSIGAISETALVVAEPFNKLIKLVIYRASD